MATLPTILLIPGAWHTPSSYNHLSLALQKKGYQITIPDLPSASPDSVGPGALAADIAHVRTVATSLLSSSSSNKKKKLIVLMHSYGGQVGSSALAGLVPTGTETDGVLHLIYMCAFALPKTMSLFDQTKESGLEDAMSAAFDVGEDGRVAMRDPKGVLFGEEGSQVKGVDGYLETLVERWNGSAMVERGDGEAWREVGMGVTYVVTTEDRMVAVERQRAMVEGMRREGVEVDVVEVKTGHCPNLTAVEEIVEVVMRAV